MRNDVIDVPGATRRFGGGVLAVGFFILLIAFLVGGPFRTVPAGHVGVKDFFGSVSPNTLSPGINIVMPLTSVVKMSMQTQEIKEVEAQGIADFQKIVAQGISAQLLEWKGIEATEKLATSSNSKVVVIGNPRSGLPVILSGDK
jgi:regulator of protease activity HflC (stomatin/prohibitin superfamily)